LEAASKEIDAGGLELALWPQLQPTSSHNAAAALGTRSSSAQLGIFPDSATGPLQLHALEDNRGRRPGEGRRGHGA